MKCMVVWAEKIAMLEYYNHEGPMFNRDNIKKLCLKVAEETANAQQKRTTKEIIDSLDPKGEPEDTIFGEKGFGKIKTKEDMLDFVGLYLKKWQ